MLDCTGEEKSASNLYFARPVPPPCFPGAVSHTSPALSSRHRRGYSSPVSGSLFRSSPARSVALRQCYSLCIAVPSLALRLRECRRNWEGSANEARGRAPAQCEIERWRCAEKSPGVAQEEHRCKAKRVTGQDRGERRRKAGNSAAAQ